MTKDETLKMALDFLMTRRMGAEAVIEALNEALAQPPLPVQPVQEPVGDEWTPCMKLPVVVHVRQQRPGESHVSTREGITPVKPDDLIMRGVSGEEYPIGRAIFEQTYSLDTAPPLPAQEQQQARVDVITVTLMREGINKHRARELADHFVNFTLTPPLPVQEPVSMRMPKVGDKVICIEDESLGEVVSLTAGGSPDILFADGSHGTYLLREFAELFGYVASPLPVQEPVAWDKPSASFNEWWNGDCEDLANPFEKDSAAYWAWAGWQAALQSKNT